MGFGECFDEDYEVFPALHPATLFCSPHTLTPRRDTPQQDGDTPEKQVASWPFGKKPVAKMWCKLVDAQMEGPHVETHQLGPSVESVESVEAVESVDSDDVSMIKEGKAAAKQQDQILPAKSWMKTHAKKHIIAFAKKKKE